MQYVAITTNPQLSTVEIPSQDRVVHGCGPSLTFLLAIDFTVFYREHLSKEFRTLFYVALWAHQDPLMESELHLQFPGQRGDDIKTGRSKAAQQWGRSRLKK